MHANNPDGNPAHTPLKLTDAKYTIPKKAGWPRWFVADAAANKGGNSRWLLVFTRGGLDEPWQVAYLTLVAPGKVPEFKKDADGWAEAVPANSTELAVAPGGLEQGLRDVPEERRGRPSRTARTPAGGVRSAKKNAKQPGLVTQYIDEPLTSGDYAPLALRTADGGALVFFTTHHYEKETAYPGTSIPTPNKDVQALTKGEIKQSLTMELISNQVALDPAKGAGEHRSASWGGSRG